MNLVNKPYWISPHEVQIQAIIYEFGFDEGRGKWWWWWWWWRGWGGGGGWGLNYFFLALGPVSRKPRLLFRPKNLFYACLVCIQNLSFNNIENNTMKLSLKEAKLAGLWARNCATIQQVSISKFAFGPETLPCLSRNGLLEKGYNSRGVLLLEDLRYLLLGCGTSWNW